MAEQQEKVESSGSLNTADAVVSKEVSRGETLLLALVIVKRS
jgi:hypothetical protein